jgi:phosphate:Na+ symporter
VGGTAALIEIAGYAALLLWGLHMVQTGMVRGLGGRLRNGLRVMLGNRFRAFCSGLAVTALLEQHRNGADACGLSRQRLRYL